ncbi:MAG: hypothetical protein A2X56_05310 [Nitrospirae bacterium GWC2_57_13]|nr:MAG: hypothetical protein A2X56_05310 [Nitrospirae bacterium GWC2_57_13]
MKLRTLLTCCMLAALASGCATTWNMRTEVSPAPIAWSDSGGHIRIRHLMTVRGFAEGGVTASNVLRYALFGRSRDADLVRPVAVAMDREGRLAIADTGCRCVHLYLPAEKRYVKLVTAGERPFLSPVSVAFDAESRMFISDSAGGFISLFDRDGVFLSFLTTAASTERSRPTGLAYLAGTGTLYGVDTRSHEIVALAADGNHLFSFGSRGAEAGKFNFPTHIAVAQDGKIYVTDAMNFRIQVFDRSGSLLASFGKHGNGSGDLSMPKGVAVDSSGVIYVVDALFDNVQLFNLKGEFLFTLGGRGAAPGEFWLPSGALIDGKDRLYVCDTYNQRVQIFQIEVGER